MLFLGHALWVAPARKQTSYKYNDQVGINGVAKTLLSNGNKSIKSSAAIGLDALLVHDVDVRV